MRRVGARWPSLTATTPSATREPQASSTAAAIAPEAFAGSHHEDTPLRRRNNGRERAQNERPHITGLEGNVEMDRATSRSVNDEASGAAVPPR